MQQYEYIVFDANKAGHYKHAEAVQDQLNKLGKEGWRLVSTVYVPDTGLHGGVDMERSRIVYYMERPLQPATVFRG